MKNFAYAVVAVALFLIAMVVVVQHARAADLTTEQASAFQRGVERSARAHIARLEKCGRDAVCRDRAHTLVANSIARLEADRFVNESNGRLVRVAERTRR